MSRPSSAWLAELARKLQHSQLQYVGLTMIAQLRLDPEETGNASLLDADCRANAMLQAGMSLMAVVSALNELEPFADANGLAPLHDLAAAIMELDAGFRAPLLQPREGVGVGGDGFSRNLVKGYVAMCARLLCEVGDPVMVACKTVADIFSKAGVRGRKGGLLSSKTVQAWLVNCEAGGDDRYNREMIERRLAVWRALPGWPLQREQALRIVKNIAKDPLIQTKI